MKKIFAMFAIGFCFSGCNVFASDNVLQAIQINGVKDSYNIILKSDDVAEIKKTIQAPNKMVLTLKGIRASKTINTIYNNTASVDSVVVEPTGDDSVKILVQAANVGGAEVHFDSLKTPLGVLGNSTEQKKSTDEIVLNDPMNSYKPVYEDKEEETSGISLAGASGSAVRQLKNVLKNDKINWMVTFGLFAILITNGMKLFKGKDSEIKIGLSQSLKEREIDLYKGLGVNGELSRLASMQNESAGSPNISGSNYGLRAYQQGTKSPYVTPEMPHSKPITAPAKSTYNLQQAVKNVNLKPQQSASQSMMQNTIQNKPQMASQMTAQRAMAPSAPKTTNIDSMKFLESMTKIYEKNGRADLAQGLKANMKKAKMNLA